MNDEIRQLEAILARETERRDHAHGAKESLNVQLVSALNQQSNLESTLRTVTANVADVRRLLAGSETDWKTSTEEVDRLHELLRAARKRARRDDITVSAIMAAPVLELVERGDPRWFGLDFIAAKMDPADIPEEAESVRFDGRVMRSGLEVDHDVGYGRREIPSQWFVKTWFCFEPGDIVKVRARGRTNKSDGNAISGEWGPWATLSIPPDIA